MERLAVDRVVAHIRGGRDGPFRSIGLTNRHFLRNQFGHPRGWLGVVVGTVMAHRASNRQRSSWTADLLEIAPDDRVLEIGCGPGVALREIAGRLDTGTVTGIDHSDIMIDQARARNLAGLRDGKVLIRHASLDDLSDIGTGYTKALAINVLQFQPSISAACTRIAAVMAEDGVLAITYQPRIRRATHGDAAAFGDHLAVALSHAGFVYIRMEEKALRPAPAICVVGRKQGDADKLAGKSKPRR